MTEQEPRGRKRPPSKRDKPPKDDAAAGHNGHNKSAARHERELAEYLQQRIKPSLNRGAIPMLARSIAKAIAQREHLDAAPEGAEAYDEPMSLEDFEAEMHALQADLGDQWVVRFSVHGGDAWLTAETADATQRVEAPTADVLVKAVT